MFSPPEVLPEVSSSARRRRRWGRIGKRARLVALPALVLLIGLPAMAAVEVENAPPPAAEPAGAGAPADATPPTADAAPEAAAGEGDAKAAEPAAEIKGEKVVVGAYLNDIQSLDLKTHTYAADVYLWFRWTSKDFDPAESMEFVNPAELWGHIRNNDNEAPQELDDGQRYQVVRVQGRFSCKLPLYDYPLDKQVLFIEFEDKNLSVEAMTYVPDTVPISMNPDIKLPGLAIGTPKLVLKVRHYATNFGDPRTAKHLEFSRARIELPVHRPPVPHLIKMLLPVVCVVLCASMMFLFRTSYVDSRVELGITSLLTVVALQMTLNQDLPDIAYLVLIDKVYIATYLYVMAGIAIVVRTTHLHDDGKEAEATRLNKSGMISTTVLYFAALAGLILPPLL
ncbi:MAG: hypothetical protein EXR79_11620 [Myxococcales bacterium]|nr:hypothetical protein [Myxococcales bacterium]